MKELKTGREAKQIYIKSEFKTSLCPVEEEDKSFADLYRCIDRTGARRSFWGFRSSSTGRAFPREDEMTQTWAGHTYWIIKNKKGEKNEFSGSSLYKFIVCFNLMNIFMYFLFIEIFKYMSL